MPAIAACGWLRPRRRLFVIVTVVLPDDRRREALVCVEFAVERAGICAGACGKFSLPVDGVVVGNEAETPLCESHRDAFSQ